MRIIQIVPEARPGTGVEAVAYHLAEEWRKLGHDVTNFTLEDAHGGWLPAPGGGVVGKLAQAARVVWFSTAGTGVARRRFRVLANDRVVICHNDALCGDVYVNHGNVAAAMRARGHPWLRMIRNPLHLFTVTRDTLRYGCGVHRYVVNLTQAEVTGLRRTYPLIRGSVAVIGNGVDTTRFQPDAEDRARVRTDLGLGEDDVLALFVGHEFDRKGLPLVLGAMSGLPTCLRLLVVGGTPDQIDVAERQAAACGVLPRVVFLGAQPDPRPWFHASDFLVFPSAYESYGLVIVEALAMGLPVVATPVGCVPEVITDGNGCIVSHSVAAVRDGMRRLLVADRRAMGVAARQTAESHAWTAVAGEYLNLFERVLAERVP